MGVVKGQMRPPWYRPAFDGIHASLCSKPISRMSHTMSRSLVNRWW